MIPDEILARSKNKEMDPAAFRAAAAMNTENQYIGAMYGLDDVGVIQSAVILTVSTIDGCLYVDNLFGANLRDAALLGRLREEAERLEIKAVKLVKSETMDLGG